MDKNPTKAEAQAAGRAVLVKIVGSKAPHGALAKDRIDLFKVKVGAAKILLASESSDPTEDEVISKLMEKNPADLLAEAKALGDKLTDMELDDEQDDSEEAAGSSG